MFVFPPEEEKEQQPALVLRGLFPAQRPTEPFSVLRLRFDGTEAQSEESARASPFFPKNRGPSSAKGAFLEADPL